MRHKPLKVMVIVTHSCIEMMKSFTTMWKISQFGNHYCYVLVSLHSCVVSFHYLLQGVWICKNHNTKKINSILQETSLIHSCINKFDINILKTCVYLKSQPNPNVPKKKKNLFPFPDFIVMQHIFIHLQLMLSMF